MIPSIVEVNGEVSEALVRDHSLRGKSADQGSTLEGRAALKNSLKFVIADA